MISVYCVLSVLCTAFYITGFDKCNTDKLYNYYHHITDSASVFPFEMLLWSVTPPVYTPLPLMIPAPIQKSCKRKKEEGIIPALFSVTETFVNRRWQLAHQAAHHPVSHEDVILWNIFPCGLNEQRWNESDETETGETWFHLHPRAALTSLCLLKGDLWAWILAQISSRWCTETFLVQLELSHTSSLTLSLRITQD